LLTADEVLKRWTDAFTAIHTVRGSQTFGGLREDGTRVSIPDLGMTGAPLTTEEVYERQGDHGRYHFVAHYAKGDVITTWDGKNAYRYIPVLRELYRPLPESYASGAYWIDDVDGISLLTFIRPLSASDLKFVRLEPAGTRPLDGRTVIDLVLHMDGRTGIEFGGDGTHIYLDAKTYLPYRVLSVQPSMVGTRTAAERTMTKLEVNVGVTNTDFTLQLPADVVTIYEQAHWAPRIQTYTSLHDAAQQSGFPFYAPKGSQPKEIYAASTIEKDGKRSPVISFYLDHINVTQGIYLPQFGRLMIDPQSETHAFDFNGQQVTLRLSKFDSAVMIVHTEQTVIEMSGMFDKEQAIQLLNSLALIQ